MSRQEELEGIVRESGSLVERLEMCRARIAAMCKEGRPPKMTIPVQWNDDDFFISVTLKDAQQCVQRTGLTCPSCKSDNVFEAVICVNCGAHSAPRR